MDDFVERNASIIFLVIGLLLVVAAALLNRADGVRIAFAVLGVGLIAIGGLQRRLIAAKLGAQGLEVALAEYKRREEQVLAEAPEPIRNALIEVFGLHRRTPVQPLREDRGGAGSDCSGGGRSTTSARA